MANSGPSTSHRHRVRSGPSGSHHRTPSPQPRTLHSSGSSGSHRRTPSSKPRSLHSAPAKSEAEAEPEPGKLYICGLPKHTTAGELSIQFQTYGEVTEAYLLKDRRTRQPRGSAFITFADPSVVDTVLSKSHSINGKQVVVKKAIPKAATGIDFNDLNSKVRRIFMSSGDCKDAAKKLLHSVRETNYHKLLLMAIVNNAAKDPVFSNFRGQVIKEMCNRRTEVKVLLDPLFRDIYGNIEGRKDGELNNVAHLFAYLVGEDLLHWSSLSLLRVLREDSSVTNDKFAAYILMHLDLAGEHSKVQNVVETYLLEVGNNRQNDHCIDFLKNYHIRM